MAATLRYASHGQRLWPRYQFESVRHLRAVLRGRGREIVRCGSLYQTERVADLLEERAWREGR